jgi:hypothetical protein
VAKARRDLGAVGTVVTRRQLRPWASAVGLCLPCAEVAVQVLRFTYYEKRSARAVMIDVWEASAHDHGVVPFVFDPLRDAWSVESVDSFAT